MRKIAVFTGTRAEYGLLYWIIKYLHESDQAELILIVGGMHLSHEFGYTVSEIEKDGFPIAERLDFLLSSDSPAAISKSMGLAMIGAAEALERHQPDLIVLLGDRYEAMAVAQAAMVANVPIAHLHGGEATEGIIDEAVRHSITKMSHLHFTSTEMYRKRVIQLGEQPNSVFSYGAPGIDSIIRLPLLSREDLSEAIGFTLDKPYFLLTYHPVTLTSGGGSESLQNLLFSLDIYPDYQVVISYPNADTDGRKLIGIIEAYREKHPKRVYLSRSLGQLRYLSVMKHCEAVIGNSSSGLIEAPTFGIPTVNIGNRQKGRIAGSTVITCEENQQDITNAVKRAVDPSFRKECQQSKNPYGQGNSSEQIVNQLLLFPLSGILNKSFFDMDQNQ